MAKQPALGFAGLLRQLRAEARLTQEELAMAAGLSLQSVSDLERGINRAPSEDTAALLGGALGLAEPVRGLFVAVACGRIPATEVLTAVRGSGPRVWNIPARNPGFAGRDDLLAEVRERLLAGDRAVVQALHGMGGVGKTQLAAEYAHRFAGAYDLAWWINAEQGRLIGDQLAALGLSLGCVQAGAGTEAMRAAVLAELRQRGRWLLVFDNAENPADVAPWLPGGGGHVLITSRERGWAEVAAPVEVDVLARAESAAILRARVPGLTGADADRLAAELGDLPLAIAQAAGFMAGTGLAADEFLDLLRTRAGQLLAQEAPGYYPGSLAAATGLIEDRLADQDPAAAELATLCAFLAAEPIPEDLFTGAVSDRLGEDHEHTLTAAQYLAWTLLEMGRYAESRDLNRDTLDRRRRVLVQDHPDTLNSAHNLAIGLRELGEVQAARDLDRDALKTANGMFRQLDFRAALA